VLLILGQRTSAFTASATTNNTLPLLYNTTTNEVQYNNQPDVEVTLTGTITLTANTYNRFVFITSVASATDRLNLPTPVVAFPSSITIFNSSATNCLLGTVAGSQIRVGATTSTTITLTANTSITLQTNGTVWVRTATG
jgi:hypothetical protein